MSAAFPYLQQIIEQQLSGHERVLMAPLNWGMGHAVRCIPLIKACLEAGKTTYIATDGQPLSFLKKEFPVLTYLELPSYEISYPFESIVLNLLYQTPKIIRIIQEEHNEIQKIIATTGCTAIISDNRIGACHEKTLNIYMTHQMNIVHRFPWLATAGTHIHRYMMRRFDRVWIPDYEGKNALAPALSQTHSPGVTYLGPLTTITHTNGSKDLDISVILSGPEPQRTFLENQLAAVLNELSFYSICFVRGCINDDPVPSFSNHVQVLNTASRKQISHILGRTRLLISRSGYTSVMDTFSSDIHKIWIPTPGQSEQEYLAERMSLLPDNVMLHQNDINKLKNIIISRLK